MAVIAEILSSVDGTVSSIGAQAYGTIAGQVIPVVRVASVLVVVLTGLNLMIQAIPLTLANGISLIVRVGLVGIFLGSYSNFDAVYGTLTNAPAEIGGLILKSVQPTGAGDVYQGLDELYRESLKVGQAVSENGSYISGALTSVAMFIISALMATVSIIVICAAKLMLGVLILIAPLAIATTLFKQTGAFFEAFVKLAIGFAMVPLLTAAMAGFTIAAATSLSVDLNSVATIGDVISFIVIMMLGTGLMLMVPTIAQSLGATSIGIGSVAASTYSQTRSAGNAAAASTRGFSQGVGGKSQRELGPASSARRVGHSAGSASAGVIHKALSVARKSAGQGK